MEKKEKRDVLKIIAQVVIVIGVVFLCWVVYQSMIVVPQNKIDSQERQQVLEIQAERLQEIAKKSEYDECIRGAYSMYSEDWDSTCGVEGLESECTLPNWRAIALGESRKNNESDCLAIYKR